MEREHIEQQIMSAWRNVTRSWDHETIRSYAEHEYLLSLAPKDREALLEELEVIKEETNGEPETCEY